MKRTVVAVGFVGLVSLCAVASASPITGVLNFTGAAQISLGHIDFVGGTFDINSPALTQQGGFQALAGTKGTIKNITQPPDSTGPLDIPDFITFSAAPNISITLTFLDPGIEGSAGCFDSPAAAGQVCTPDFPQQSPFNLTNTSATSSAASFNVLGTEVDSLTGKTVPITGAFTTPFTNLNYQQILADVEGGRTITTAFSAQFAATPPPTVPEPGTLTLLMTGIAAVAVTWIGRKKFQKE